MQVKNFIIKRKYNTKSILNNNKNNNRNKEKLNILANTIFLIQ